MLSSVQHCVQNLMQIIVFVIIFVDVVVLFVFSPFSVTNPINNNSVEKFEHNNTEGLNDSLLLLDTHFSPPILQENSSTTIRHKLDIVHTEYEKLLQISSKKWTVMRVSENVTIERAETSYGGPNYLKTTARFSVPPSKLTQLFSWDHFHQTQSSIDPFYESSQLLFNVSYQCKVVRKTTKRPLIFPKRYFHLSLCEGLQASDMNIVINNAWAKTVTQAGQCSTTTSSDISNSANLTRVRVEKGTTVSSLMTFSLPNEDEFVGKYVKSFQDFIAWFIDDREGGTLLVILMRVDLGSDIPNWAFLTTVAATGVWSMQAMMKLSREFNYSTVEERNVSSNSLKDGNDRKGWHRKVLEMLRI